MEPVIIDAGVVGFNRDDRIVTGMLLPYGEECRSSVGRFTFGPGIVEIPQDVPGIVGFNIEHERDQSVGRGVTVTETPQGLLGTFRVAQGAEGDAALDDIASGKRKHLSAEVTGLRIKGGKALAAKLFGAALVEKPAFPSAALFAAADTDDSATDTDGDEEVLNESKSTAEWTDEAGKTWNRTETSRTVKRGNETTTTITYVLEEPEAPADNSQEGTMANATAPVGFSAPASAPAPAGKAEARKISKRAFFSAILKAQQTGNFGEALADVLTAEERIGLFALADATYDQASDAGKVYYPQYLQDIWEGDDDPAERRIIPLLAHGDLTELWFDDSEWLTKATVGRWTGDKTAIPSTKPTRRRNAPKKAQPFAGGLDIALEYKHFGHEDQIEEFVKQLRDSYATESDEYVAEELLLAATDLVYADPTGGTIREVFVKIVQGMLAVRRTGKAKPTFALVANDMYEEWLYTKKDEVLHFLATSAGLDEASFAEVKVEPWDGLTAGQVLVGARKAATVLELPGAPIRINALDIARGGHDEALFGYVGFRTQRAAALQLVSDPPPPAV